MIFKNLILLNIFIFSNSLNEETILRNNLMTSYNKYVRPVNNYEDNLEIRMGLAVQNIEEFDQKKETLDLNIWVRMNWYNNILNWNLSNYNISFLSVNVNEIWTPDIELLNAASKPTIYILDEALNLYNDGSIFRSKPGIFKFSCSLDLHEFPFDIQRCRMRFGSWTHNTDMMSIIPYEEIEKQIDVLPSFSHSEWDINRYSLNHYNESRVCCPGKNFSINEYTFELQRFPHYYKLSMGMTISLVIVSFIIMLMKPDNVSRTGTAVFIPLTILALQLTIADKIPVVGYYTLMDNFFLCCFISSMFVSIESGLIFSLITTKSNLIYRIFQKLFNMNDLYKNYKMNKIKLENKKNKHHNFITNLNGNKARQVNQARQENKAMQENKVNKVNKENQNSNQANRIIKKTNPDNEFKTTIEVLTNPYINENDTINEIEENIIMTNIDIEDNININNNFDFNIIDKDIIKVINFDDENLSLSLKQILVFDKITQLFSLIDNIFRVLLPLIFIIIISIIMSYEK